MNCTMKGCDKPGTHALAVSAPATLPHQNRHGFTCASTSICRCPPMEMAMAETRFCAQHSRATSLAELFGEAYARLLWARLADAVERQGFRAPDASRARLVWTEVS